MMRIDAVLGRKRGSRHGQVRPGRQQPGTGGKLLPSLLEPTDQRQRQPSARTVAADRDVLCRDALPSQKAPRRQRILQRCRKRMLRREAIATASVRTPAARPASVTRRRWLRIEPEQ